MVRLWYSDASLDETGTNGAVRPGGAAVDRLGGQELSDGPSAGSGK